MRARYVIAVIPALLFWVASLIFFVLGFASGGQNASVSFMNISIDDTRMILQATALGLAIANTVIQIIGNDADPDELGTVLRLSWYASYVLGISSSVYGLTLIIHIPNKIIEWLICGSLGTMIEVTPERLFVLFWRSVFPDGVAGTIRGMFESIGGSINRGRRPNRSNHSRHNSNDHHHASSNDNPQRRIVTSTDGRKFEVPPRPAQMPRAEYRAYLRQYFREQHNAAIPEFESEGENA